MELHALGQIRLLPLRRGRGNDNLARAARVTGEFEPPLFVERRRRQHLAARVDDENSQRRDVVLRLGVGETNLSVIGDFVFGVTHSCLLRAY